MTRLLARVPWRPRTSAEIAKRRAQGALFVLLLLLAAVVAAGLLSAFSLYRSAESRYIQVVFPLHSATRDLVLQMVNEETGVRGYMITTNRRSLAPYFSGRKRAMADLAEIARLTKGHPRLSQRLEVLRREIQQLHGYYDRLITFVADGQIGLQRARTEVFDNERAFNRFRRTAAETQQDINVFVQETRAGQRATFHRSVGTLVIAGFFGLAIAGSLLVGVPERLRQLYLAEEQARRRAEQGANAARAIAHVSDAVVLVDDSERIRSWNPAAERQFGVAAGAALGRPVRAVVPGYDRLAGTEGTFVPVTVAGEERWLAPATSTFDGGLVLTVRDVTTAQMLEQARTDFVATASHELRTPLTSIYGAASTLLGRDGLTEERRLQLLRMIEEESGQLARIVDQLLVTARLTRGKLAQSAAPCDVRSLAERVLASAEARVPDGTELSLSAPEAVAPFACDEGLLRQVLVSLVDNAVKYSPEGGRVEVRLHDESDRLRIEVRDEGLGIAPSEQERIFEKFHRVDAGMSRGVGGSGLGLYIAREIVTQMDGTISVESAPDSGSTFAVTLPRPVA
jgi:PAS domain S-box-containing protein